MSDIARALQALGPVMHTTLPEDEERKFRAWLAQFGIANPDGPEQFYDYRAAYRAGVGPDETGHWPSEFKMEGHPNLVVGGYDTRDASPRIPYRQETDIDVLVSKGWPREEAAQMVARLKGSR